MKISLQRIVAFVLAAALSSSAASAGNVYQDCSPCDPCAPICSAKKSKLKIGGWLEASYYRNGWGQETSYAFDENLNRNVVDNGNSSYLGSFQNADPQMNQAWLYLEREMDTTHGFDWGFRIDGAFGTDVSFAQAFNDQTFDWNAGEGDYYWSMPSLYGTVGYKNLSVKIGRFETLLGYESFKSPGKFFVSHSYQYDTEPLATTGILAEYALGERVTLLAGYSMGNDTWENRFGDSQIIGGVSVDLTEKLSLSYMFNVGYEYNGVYKNGIARYNYSPTGFWHGDGTFHGDRHNNYYQTIVLEWQLTDRLSYVLQSNYFQSEFTGPYDPITVDGYAGIGKSYGVANYLTYQLNKRWALGFRAEWFRTEYAGMFGSGRQSQGNDFYEYTLGLKWTPWERLSVLGEIRYDQAWDDAGGALNVFDAGRHGEQFSGGISAILTF